MTIHSEATASSLRAGLASEMPGEESSAILLSLILAEIHGSATGQQEHGFLTAVGRRIAQTFPLPNRFEMDALAGAMNRVWARFSAGNVRLSVQADGIGIHHHLPTGHDQADGLWQSAGPSILEGAYAHWFGGMTEERLSLTCVARSPDTVEYRYGR